MSEANMVRASLDQALLALAALEEGDTATAQVHATLAGALAAHISPQTAVATGPMAGNRPRQQVAVEDAAAQWQVDIETLDAPAEVFVPGPDVPEPAAPVVVEPIGRARVRARREGIEEP